MSQLLHNLVGNAMKYGRAGTPVTVRLEPGDTGDVTLTVVDRGDGIPPEHLPRLTERFYSVGSGRSRALGDVLDDQIGRAHVWTPVTNAHLVCRLLLDKNKRPRR